jgi:predicted transcriptional regulator
MSTATTAVGSLRAQRQSLGLSQSRLARISGVRRFKICTYELGDGTLTAEEQDQIRNAIQSEIARLRGLVISVEFDNQAVQSTEVPG